MVTEDQVQRAVDYLRNTAEEYGKACGRLAYLDGNLRRIKSLEMLEAKGTLGEREAQAYASQAYKEALEQLEEATATRETLRAMRDAAQARFEQWRSEGASRRQGA